MNFIGVVAALTAFLSVWFGHIAVRKIEFVSLTIWIPSAIFVILGLTAEVFSLYTVNRPLSTVFGILGITLLFDAFELTRQQKRVKKGHAPANPNNPRHAKFLADANLHATTLDLLRRDPTGRPVTAEQVIKLSAE
jgi:hypothetical protein